MVTYSIPKTPIPLLSIRISIVWVRHYMTNCRLEVKLNTSIYCFVHHEQVSPFKHRYVVIEHVTLYLHIQNTKINKPFIFTIVVSAYIIKLIITSALVNLKDKKYKIVSECTHEKGNNNKNTNNNKGVNSEKAQREDYRIINKHPSGIFR
ncbi:hypothetical protein BCR42DRAFT_419871 [Absidia repens]|uniref:Uncharacterized protein n=1 Tax=Absidia repens TaxID=90262 RepID=A0A1X2IAF8_9FUNG|nr:hypothetical protein BCR42DRAFT_419871 [Absidia repens]